MKGVSSLSRVLQFQVIQLLLLSRACSSGAETGKTISSFSGKSFNILHKETTVRDESPIIEDHKSETKSIGNFRGSNGKILTTINKVATTPNSSTATTKRTMITTTTTTEGTTTDTTSARTQSSKNASTRAKPTTTSITTTTVPKTTTKRATSPKTTKGSTTPGTTTDKLLNTTTKATSTTTDKLFNTTTKATTPVSTSYSTSLPSSAATNVQNTTTTSPITTSSSSTARSSSTNRTTSHETNRTTSHETNRTTSHETNRTTSSFYHSTKPTSQSTGTKATDSTTEAGFTWVKSSPPIWSIVCGVLLIVSGVIVLGGYGLFIKFRKPRAAGYTEITTDNDAPPEEEE